MDDSSTTRNQDPEPLCGCSVEGIPGETAAERPEPRTPMSEREATADFVRHPRPRLAAIFVATGRRNLPKARAALHGGDAA